MRCLADFILDSDLCLVEKAATLTLHDPGAVSLTISNTQEGHALPNAVLSAQLVFEADCFDMNIRDVALDKLADALNCLTYATNRKFAVRLLKRVIDWTPGVVERSAIIYSETPEWGHG